MRRGARLLVAVIVMPAVGAAIAFLLPGGDNMALVVGWALTSIGAGIVLWPIYGDRTMGWPLVVASAVYVGIIVAVFAVLLSTISDMS